MTPPSPSSSRDDPPSVVTRAAADWLARRDRGLTPSEQDEYMQWLAADPRHGAALARQANALERMMQLYEWTPARGVEPNPDLFAPAPRMARVRACVREQGRWLGLGGLAAAAALVVLLWSGRGRVESPPGAVAAVAPASFLHVNERLALPDGSRVELNDGARVVSLYSATERRVRLAGGEAHFTVWKDPHRPFVVEADGVEVVAVGTAFNVRLESAVVEVLVTEGRVKVLSEGESTPEAAAAAATELKSGHAGPTELFVSRGERAIVPKPSAGADAMIAPTVTAVSTDEIATELAWQAPRLQFQETRLADAIAEFNRLNRHQLELLDPALGELRIGGNFRPDNVDGFVRLLGLTCDVDARDRGEDRTQLFRR